MYFLNNIFIDAQINIKLRKMCSLIVKFVKVRNHMVDLELGRVEVKLKGKWRNNSDSTILLVISVVSTLDHKSKKKI